MDELTYSPHELCSHTNKYSSPFNYAGITQLPSHFPSPLCDAVFFSATLTNDIRLLFLTFPHSQLPPPSALSHAPQLPVAAVSPFSDLSFTAHCMCIILFPPELLATLK